MIRVSQHPTVSCVPLSQCLLPHALLLHTLVVHVAVRAVQADALPLLAGVAPVAVQALLTSVTELACQQASLSRTEVTGGTVLVGVKTSALALDTVIPILAPQAVFLLSARLRIIFLLAAS